MTLRLITEVDKTVSELTNEELNKLDWSSVPKSQLPSISDDRLMKCPIDILTQSFSCDNYSNDLCLYILTSKIKKCKDFRNGYALHHLLSNFFNPDFIKNNKKEILEMLKRHEEIHSTVTFPSVIQYLMKHGIISFFDLNMTFETINDTWDALESNIPQEDWIKLITRTNYLYSTLTEHHSIQNNVIPLSTENLWKCGIKINPVVDLSWVKNGTYECDDDYVDILLEDLIEQLNCTSITWDEVLEKFNTYKLDRDNNPPYGVNFISTVWEHHIIDTKFELNRDDFFKKNLHLYKTIG